MPRKALRTILTLGMLLVTCSWAALPAQAAGTVLFCPSNQAMLEAAIGAAGPGGTMLFSCDASITLSSTIALADVSLDGNGFDVTLDGNHAVRIFTVSGTVSLTGLNLVNGSTGSDDEGHGGAIISAANSVLTVTNSTLDGNHAFGGGAIYSDMTVLNVINSTLTNNTAGHSGGAIYATSTYINVANSTLADNSAYITSGAIYANFDLHLTNSTLTGNTANMGGAIYASGTVTVVNSTFYENQAMPVYGGAGVASGNSLAVSYSAIATITNTILAGSSVGQCFETEPSHGSVGHNLVTDSSCGFGTEVSLEDLDLGELADNGGLTQTIALGEDSVAIGFGVLAACAAAPVNGLDQRGYTRPTTTCDSGAYDSGATRADDTVPTITPIITGTLGSNGWYTSDVIVTWSVVDDESDISATHGCDATTITTDTTGTTLICEATSAGGTASQSVTIQRDATLPVVSVTGVTDGATYTLGNVPSAGCATTDATSGVATAATLSMSSDSVGEITATCAGATDNAGNTGSASLTYTVLYDWQGFKSTTDDRRGPRKILAGLPVTVIFFINGNVGLDAVESITTIACNAAPGTEPVPAMPAGSRGQLQQGAGGSYIFQWQPTRWMAGTCQELRVTLVDGTTWSQTYQFQR